MRRLALLLLALALVPASNAFARDWDPDPNLGITLNPACNPPSRLAPRLDTRDARFSITTDDEQATLLLTNKVVAIQLSDRAFHSLHRKFRDIQLEDDNVLAQTIKAVVLGTVEAMLDHRIECPIRDIDDVQYRNGRLVFITSDNDTIFENIDVHDRNVLEGFSEADARAFVREFKRVKDRSTL
ncbi:MAG TPA: hypothetical protein VMJ70_12355 [Candidatus Sulfotelmatobacter sp.]|nr:hypothetical protein [Candidatus Sulfotelmatobacter sp.]